MLFLSILTGFQKLLSIFLIRYVYECVCLCVGVYMCVCMCLQKPEGMDIPGTWVKSSLWATQHGCYELNSGPLQKWFMV